MNQKTRKAMFGINVKGGYNQRIFAGRDEIPSKFSSKNVIVSVKHIHES